MPDIRPEDVEIVEGFPEHEEAAPKPNGYANGHPYPHAKNAAGDDEGWPTPLSPDAYHGIAGEVVRAFEPHTEADPAALLLQFLAAFGNAAGRGSYFLSEDDPHPPQLWPVLVGKSAKARKGTSWGRIRRLFGEVTEATDWVRNCQKSGLSSGEGLIWQVRDRILKEITDKKTGLTEQVEEDPGVRDKRLLVYEGEFASPLRNMERSGNTLSSTLRSFWDGGQVSALTKNSPAKTTGAMVTVIGHITARELRQYLTRTEMGNGLANRFLFVCVKRSKRLPFGGKRIDVSQLANRIGRELYKLQGGNTPISMDEAASELWDRVYDDLSRDRFGLVGAVTSRAEPQVIRLALTYALLDGKDHINVLHLMAALEVWRYCEESAAFLFKSGTGDPLADEIHGFLKGASGGLTRAEIYDLLGRHRRKDEISKALALLYSAEIAKSETKETGGRPEERWFSAVDRGREGDRTYHA